MLKDKLALPFIDVWDPAYIERAKRHDRCSCSPDTLHGVYIGNLCARHDERYRWIWQRKAWGRWPYGFKWIADWTLRLRLKWLADHELGDGVHEAFTRAGQHHGLIPWRYRWGVVFFNLPFRMIRAWFRALTFRC